MTCSPNNFSLSSVALAGAGRRELGMGACGVELLDRDCGCFIGLARWGLICCGVGCLGLNGMVVVGVVGARTEHSPIAFVVETPRHRPTAHTNDASIAQNK